MRSDDDLSAALTPELCEGARAWLAAPAKRITKAESTTTLFVLEGSWAAVPRDSAHLEWIGTDDATTCHCIALVSPTHVAVSHLNDAAPAEQNLRDMVEAVKEGAPVPVTAPIELWVAGGMGGAGVPADVTQLSLETSAAVLEALETVRRASRGAPVVLRLACIGHLNATAADGCPACRGLCVNLRSGAVVRADFDDDARGREFARRYGAHHLAAPAPRLACGYDAARDAYLVPAPTAERCADVRMLRFLAYMATQLSDEQLLQHSTSPGYERPRFAQDQRASAEAVLAVAREAALRGSREASYASCERTADGRYFLVPRLLPVEAVVE